MLQTATSKHDEAIERDVLGILLKYPGRMHDSGVSDRHFYLEMHKRVLKEFRSRGPAVSCVMDASYQDMEAVANISEAGWSDACLKEHLDHLERLAEIREAAFASRRLLDELESTYATEARDVIQSATGRLASVVHAPKGKTVTGNNARESLLSPVGEKMNLYLRNFYIRRGDLIFLAATPGSGKTTLAQNVQRDLIQHFDGLNVMFTMEMSPKEIFEKDIQVLNRNRIDQYLPGLGPDGKLEVNPKFEEAAEKVEAWYNQQPGMLVLEGRGGITVEQIRARCMELQATHGRRLRCIVIDQLDKIQHAHRGNDNHTVGVKSTTAALKMLALEMDIGILCLAQISTKTGSGEGGLFTMKDLYGSSAMEQDGSQVWILQMAPGEDIEEPFRRTILKIEKRRGGSVGFGLELIFDTRASTLKEGGF